MRIQIQSVPLFTKTQIFFIWFGILAQVSYFESIRYFFQRQVWGYPRLGWVIPNEIVKFGGFEVNSNSLLTLHVATSVMLYGALLIQLCLMLFVPNSPHKLRAHRTLGFTIVGVLLPVFVFLALIVDLILIKNPTNQILFAVIPVMITYGFFKVVHGIRASDTARHIDGIFLILLCLNAAAITRLSVGMLYVSGFPVSFLFENHEPIAFAAITRTVLLIVILALGFSSSNRLIMNKNPLLFLALVLGVSVLV
jgi:hypothetical protein